MADFDQKIRDELKAVNGEYDERKEGLIRDVVISSFRGRMRSATLLAWLMMVIYSAAAIFCGVMVHRAEEMREMVLYGAFLVIAVVAVMVVKLWYWMLANRNAVQREVKRLETLIWKALDARGE